MKRPGQVMVPLTVMLALLYVQLAPDVEVEADSSAHSSLCASAEHTLDDLPPVGLHSPSAILDSVDIAFIETGTRAGAVSAALDSVLVSDFLHSHPGRAPPLA